MHFLSATVASVVRFFTLQQGGKIHDISCKTVSLLSQSYPPPHLQFLPKFSISSVRRAPKCHLYLTRDDLQVHHLVLRRDQPRHPLRLPPHPARAAANSSPSRLRPPLYGPLLLRCHQQHHHHVRIAADSGRQWRLVKDLASLPSPWKGCEYGRGTGPIGGSQPEGRGGRR